MKMMNLPLSKINDWIEKCSLNERMIQLVVEDSDKGYIYCNVYLKNEDVIEYQLHISKGTIDYERIYLSEADEEGGWFEREQIDLWEANEMRELVTWK